MNYNRRFYQLRSMTKRLDESFKGDQEYLKKFCSENKSEKQFDFSTEKQLIQEWISYREKNLPQIIASCFASVPPFKICLCDFLKNRRVSLEFWYRVLHDVFNNELEGKILRYKFWNHMRIMSNKIEQDLIQRMWPHEWAYIEKEACLSIEILKIYECYSPIRVFFALNINQLANDRVFVDVRRLPTFLDERKIEIELKNGWIDKLNMQVPTILNDMQQVNNLYCHNILEFSHKMYYVTAPILKMISHKKSESGYVVNFYGEHYDFIYEVLNSLKSACGTGIRTCHGSLKLSREFKNQRQSNLSDFVVVSMMLDIDVNNEVIDDIRDNIRKGYNSFNSHDGLITPKLIIILSPNQLKLKVPQVEYLKLESIVIGQILQEFDYEFLVYYANILYEKTMVVQQNGGSRKPYFSLFITMWAYVFPKFYENYKFAYKKVEKLGSNADNVHIYQNLQNIYIIKQSLF